MRRFGDGRPRSRQSRAEPLQLALEAFDFGLQPQMLHASGQAFLQQGCRHLQALPGERQIVGGRLALRIQLLDFQLPLADLFLEDAQARFQLVDARRIGLPLGVRDVRLPGSRVDGQSEHGAGALGQQARAVQKRAVEAGQQLLAIDAGGGEVEPDQRIAGLYGRPLADVDVLDDAPLEMLDHLDLALRHHFRRRHRHLVQPREVRPDQ